MAAPGGAGAAALPMPLPVPAPMLVPAPPPFPAWLAERLDALGLDRAVYGAYIEGLLREEESDEERLEALRAVLAACLVRGEPGSPRRVLPVPSVPRRGCGLRGAGAVPGTLPRLDQPRTGSTPSSRSSPCPHPGALRGFWCLFGGVVGLGKEGRDRLGLWAALRVPEVVFNGKCCARRVLGAAVVFTPAVCVRNGIRDGREQPWVSSEGGQGFALPLPGSWQAGECREGFLLDLLPWMMFTVSVSRSFS